MLLGWGHFKSSWHHGIVVNYRDRDEGRRSSRLPANLQCTLALLLGRVSLQHLRESLQFGCHLCVKRGKRFRMSSRFRRTQAGGALNLRVVFSRTF
jgi:hypothetical protein